MKKILGFLLSLLIGAFLFVWVGKLAGWQGLESAFFVLCSWQGLIVLFLTVLIKMTRVFRLRVILQSRSHHISNWVLSKIFLAGRAIAFIAPTLVLADEAFVAYALKEKNSLSWQESVIALIIDKVLYLTGFFATLFLGLAVFFLKIGLSFQILCLVLAVFVLASFLIFLFYSRCFRGQSLIKLLLRLVGRELKNNGNKAMEIEANVFSFFDKGQRYVWQGLFLALAYETLYFLRCWALMSFLAKDADIFSVLAIFSFARLATAIPIPAALGSHEALQIFAFSSLGLESSLVTAFTMILRGAEFIASLIGGFFLFQLGAELFKTSLFKKIDIFFNNNNKNKNKGDKQENAPTD